MPLDFLFSYMNLVPRAIPLELDESHEIFVGVICLRIGDDLCFAGTDFCY